MKKLTDKQDKFALKVARGATNVEAFKAAGYAWKETDDPQYLAKIASAVATNPNVQERIAELTERKAKVAEREFDMDVTKLLQTFIEIAFVDPNELITVRQGCCRHCHGDGFLYQWREREYLEELARWEKAPGKNAMPDVLGGFGYLHTREPHPDCDECGGEGVTRLVPKDSTKLSPGARHLYRGAQHTKDGIKILFADKDGALDKIGRILGAYDDRLRVDLKAAVATLQLTTSDPVEAAREYQKMLTGG